MPIFFAVSSVSVVERNFVFTRGVPPDGRGPTFIGMGGSPSSFSKLSAISRNARRPIIIRWKRGGNDEHVKQLWKSPVQMQKPYMSMCLTETTDSPLG